MSKRKFYVSTNGKLFNIIIAINNLFLKASLKFILSGIIIANISC